MENQKWPDSTVIFNDGSKEEFKNMCMEFDDFVVEFSDLDNHKSYYIPLCNVREIISE